MDLLLAAAIAAERKPGAGGRKPGAKMLRLLQEDSSRVCQDESAEQEVSFECQRLLEAFGILNQLYEVTATNHFETLTLANICSHGASNRGGVLCRKTVRQMVHLCPDLFIIRPGFDQSDETLITLQLVTPPRMCSLPCIGESSEEEGEGEAGGGAHSGNADKSPRHKRARTQQYKAKSSSFVSRDQQRRTSLKQQLNNAKARFAAMRAAVIAFHSSASSEREVPQADLLSDAVCARPLPAHVDHGPGHLFCSSSERLDVDDLIQHLQQLSGKNQDCVQHVHVVPPRLKRVMSTKHILQSKVQDMLRIMGVSQEKLYLHQARAVDAALEGGNVIVTTATASGKSLCFNIPVMNAVLNPNGAGVDNTTTARALYIYPTKALTQDQLRAIHKFSDAWLSKAKVAVLDGDTPMNQRRDILQGASIILTNPDMLHVSILPQHASISTLLSALKFIVIDEAHMYHGAFGVHVAMVLRRLRRLCAHYGASPQFLCCSATIASPASHLSQLTGVEEASFLVVSEDGSPSGEKRFVLWNPPARVSSKYSEANTPTHPPTTHTHTMEPAASRFLQIPSASNPPPPPPPHTHTHPIEPAGLRFFQTP